VALAACGDDSANEPGAPSAQPVDMAQAVDSTTPEAEPAAQRRGPLVRLRDSQFGPVIFNGRAQAAYFFTRDARGRSRCYGECAVAWPPFYARARPRAGRGIKRSLLGTVRRKGGRRQVTYAGKPLYFYEHDPPGEVLCNDIVEFGGTWFAVTAEGKAPA
jgi:predicted lipoprotein with Yx(FWY)xxD motif